MNNENSGGGFLSVLIAGAGILGVLALPGVIARRFGMNVLSFLVALGVTGIALYSGELVALANDLQGCVPACNAAADSFAKVVVTMDGAGWWLFAALSWAMWLMRVLFVSVPTVTEQD